MPGCWRGQPSAHPPSPPAAHLLLLLQMWLRRVLSSVWRSRRVQAAPASSPARWPVAAAAAASGSRPGQSPRAPQTGGAGNQPLPLLFMFLVVALGSLQPARALGLQDAPRALQGRGWAGNLAGQPLPTRSGRAARPRRPAATRATAGCPATDARAGPHLLVEPAAPPAQALARGRFLLAPPSPPFWGVRWRSASCHLLLELLVLAGQLARLLARPAAAAPPAGSRQLLLAAGRPLLPDSGPRPSRYSSARSTPVGL